MQIIQPHYHAIARTGAGLRAHGDERRRGRRRAGVLGGLRPPLPRDVHRLLPADQRVRADAGRPVWHPALLLGGGEPQGGREPDAHPRSHRALSRVLREAHGARRRRDGPAQVDEERMRVARGPCRHRDEARPARAHPHAAPRRQGPRHEAGARGARRHERRPRAGLDRPRRGADDPRPASTPATGWASRSTPSRSARRSGRWTCWRSTARSGSS